MNEPHDDFAFEPVRGLPERLPQGETMLWQGAPDWRGLARSAFHVRKVAAYFCLLLAWQAVSAYRGGTGLSGIAASTGATAIAAAATIAILGGLAWAYARTTVYTLTTKRIVIRSGLALPVTVNLPLSLVASASLARHRDGTGSIAVEIAKPNRVALLVLWPNVRPWRLTDPQPMLRALPDPDAVVLRLRGALGVTDGAAARPAPSEPARREPAIGPASSAAA